MDVAFLILLVRQHFPLSHAHTHTHLHLFHFHGNQWEIFARTHNLFPTCIPANNQAHAPNPPATTEQPPTEKAEEGKGGGGGEIERESGSDGGGHAEFSALLSPKEAPRKRRWRMKRKKKEVVAVETPTVAMETAPVAVVTPPVAQVQQVCKQPPFLPPAFPPPYLALPCLLPAYFSRVSLPMPAYLYILLPILSSPFLLAYVSIPSPFQTSLTWCRSSSDVVVLASVRWEFVSSPSSLLCPQVEEVTTETPGEGRRPLVPGSLHGGILLCVCVCVCMCVHVCTFVCAYVCMHVRLSKLLVC